MKKRLLSLIMLISSSSLFPVELLQGPLLFNSYHKFVQNTRTIIEKKNNITFKPPLLIIKPSSREIVSKSVLRLNEGINISQMVQNFNHPKNANNQKENEKTFSLLKHCVWMDEINKHFQVSMQELTNKNELVTHFETPQNKELVDMLYGHGNVTWVVDVTFPDDEEKS